MRGAVLALLLFAGAGRGRLGRSLLDVPMERMFLDMQIPVSGQVVVLGAVGLSTRPKDMRELVLERDRRRQLLFSVGVDLYFQ